MENILFAVFDCPEEFSDDQLKEIQLFVEFVELKGKENIETPTSMQ